MVSPRSKRLCGVVSYKQIAPTTEGAEMSEKTEMSTDLALLGVLALLWGASYTFIKIGVETIPPVTFIAARTLIA